MKNTLLKIGMSVLPVEQELTVLTDNEIYVVASKSLIKRSSLLQDMQQHPYRDEAYLIEGEWEGGEHAFFSECRLKAVYEREDGNVAFTFSFNRKMPIG